jgi:hypothetical protein
VIDVTLWLLAGAALIVMPFDFWQIAPSRQRHRPIGRLLGGVLDISFRNILIRALAALLLLVLYLMTAVWLSVMAGFFLALTLLVGFGRTITGRSMGEGASVAGAIIMIVVPTAFAIGSLVPLRTLTPLVYVLQGYPAGTLLEALSVGEEWAAIDSVIGVCGLLGVVSWLLVDAAWRSRQARQIDNLATSTIGSLAVGLVEITGTVRPIAGAGAGPAIELVYGMADYLEPKQTINRFLLDDGTGTVMVDATRCRVRAGWISEVRTVFGAREIVLTRRVSHNDRRDEVRRELLYGDRVYVIGNAERDSSGELVVRPAGRSGWNETIWRTVFGAVKPPKGRDIHDVFFLADGGEARAKRYIMQGFRVVALFGCLWGIASVGVIWSAQQEWRQAPPPDSWRNAYWRGRPDDPMRRARFDRYMKTIDKTSVGAIPALLEAMTYDDSRYKDPATWSLIPLASNSGALSRDAVSILIANLRTDDARLRQTTILALAAFGREAHAAVPALIEQLGTQQTGSWEVPPTIIRMQAAFALGRIGAPAREAMPALRHALGDPSVSVQRAAAEALRRIEPDSGSG